MLSAAHRILLFGGRRLSFAGQALLAETAGLAFDARDMSAVVKGHTTNFDGDVNGLFTYTSPSTKYVRNSAGLLVPGTTMRCDHDASGNKLGLLIEEQRTNLFLRSAEFDNASWSKTRLTVTADQAIAPDGTLSADKIQPNGNSNNNSWTDQSVNTGAVLATNSVYAKPAGLNWIQLYIGGSSACNAYFDVANGVVGTIAGSASNKSASIEPAGNGWYRCKLTCTNSAGAQNVGYTPAEADNDSVFAAGTTNGLYVWGAQIEAGAFPTSYIPTAGSQVTRAADTITLATSAFPLNAAAGTLVVNVSWLAGSTVSPNNAMAAVLSDTTSGERIILYNISGNAGYAMIDGGSTVASGQNGAPVAANVQANIGVAYELNSTIGAINGGLTSLDTSCTIPDFTRLSIGSSHTGVSASVNGHVLRLSYRPRRVSDTELQALSA